jgi:hypothetical protein
MQCSICDIEEGLQRNARGEPIIRIGYRNRTRSLWLAYIIFEALTALKRHMDYGTV